MNNKEKNQLETLSLAYKTLEMNYMEKYVENDKLKSENAELTSKYRQLELALFTVVRNFKVLPVGLRLGKTKKEITDMTLETIEKIKQSINYNAVEELIKENKND